MNPLLQRPRSSVTPPRTDDAEHGRTTSLPAWQLNLMRVGYPVMGGGLALTKWPELVARACRGAVG